MLTEEEKWRFDLHGYLVLKQAVAASEVERMVALSDEWHALEDADLPEPLRTVFCRYSTAYASWSPGARPMEDFRQRLSDEI